MSLAFFCSLGWGPKESVINELVGTTCSSLLIATSNLSLHWSLSPLIFHNHWFSFEHWVIYSSLRPPKGWANVIIKIILFFCDQQNKWSLVSYGFVLMWYRCVDSRMYIKQCLHMLTILSVTALLGPISSIWLSISLKLPLYKFRWNLAMV